MERKNEDLGKNRHGALLLDFQKNVNQERINNLIIELSRPGDDMTPPAVLTQLLKISVKYL